MFHRLLTEPSGRRILDSHDQHLIRLANCPYPCCARTNVRLVYDHPSLRRPASSSLLCESMLGSSNALGIFWARLFLHRPHPSLSIRRDRVQDRAFSAIKKELLLHHTLDILSFHPIRCKPALASNNAAYCPVVSSLRSRVLRLPRTSNTLS